MDMKTFGKDKDSATQGSKAKADKSLAAKNLDSQCHWANSER
jgi:hypothetical protein